MSRGGCRGFFVFEQRGNEGKRRVVGVAVVVGGDFFLATEGTENTEKIWVWRSRGRFFWGVVVGCGMGSWVELFLNRR